MMISLGRIVSGPTSRLQPVAQAEDDALVASIRAIGVLAPVLLRPARGDLTRLDDAPIPVSGGNQMLEVVSGHRRVAAARAAGLTEIPAEVRDLDDGAAAAAQTADNIIRATLHTVDLFLAARDMIKGGLTQAQAAAALGMPERELRGLTWMAGLDPAILDLCRLDMPALRTLRQIALAPAEKQRAATALPDISEVDDDGAYVNWDAIHGACGGRRISRLHAVFDVDAVDIPWDEDLFAEPGSAEQFTTADTAGFMAAQRAALEQRVAGDKRMVWVEVDPRIGYAKLPAGYHREWGVEKAKRGQLTAFVLGIQGQVGTWILAPDKAPAKISATSDDDAAEPIEDDDDGDDSPDTAQLEAPPAPDATGGVTNDGLCLIAARKTQAVKAVLMAGDQLDAHDLLALLVLALAADNVTVRGVDRADIDALTAKLIAPDGTMRDDASEAVVRAVARSMLATVIGFDRVANYYNSRNSGPAGEWIGRFVNAESHFPRFDDDKFLATCRQPVLRKMSETAQVKWSGTVTAMRKRLEGQAEAWVPDAAVFGAPGPRS